MLTPYMLTNCMLYEPCNCSHWFWTTGYFLKIIYNYSFFRSKQLIKDAILGNDFLKNLDSTQVREIVDCMYEKRIKQGNYIIREGDAGQHVYVSAGKSPDNAVPGCTFTKQYTIRKRHYIGIPQYNWWLYTRLNIYEAMNRNVAYDCWRVQLPCVSTAFVR